MNDVAAALAPLALLVVLGAALRRGDFLEERGWAALDRLNYWVLFPALIFASLANADPDAVAGRVAFVAWGSLATVTAVVAVAAGLLRTPTAVVGSVVQGAVRFNAFVALAVIPALVPGSAALVALLVAATVPVVNVICVLAHTRVTTPARLARSLATNPLIVASLAGIAVQRTGLSLGPFGAAAELMGAASLAGGLLSVGATLDFRYAARGWRWVVFATGLKFVALPATAVAWATLLGVPTEATLPIALFHALPTASASIALGRALGGDTRLMAAILAVQTLAAIVVLPLVAAAAG